MIFSTIAGSFIFLLLYFFNQTFRYYVKYVFYTVYMLTISLITIIWVFFTCRRKNTENARFVAWSMKKLKYLYGWKIEVQGRENLISEEPIVVLCNHQSGMDLLGIMELWDWKERMTIVAKRSLMYFGTFGLACYLCDVVFIDRYDHSKAVQQMDSAVEHIRSQKLKLFVFPEGTRNHDGSMLPFKKGAFHIAIKAKAPIVPVVFSSYGQFYSKSAKILKPGKVIIKCLPPVPTAGLSKDDIPDLLESIRNSMIDTFKEISPKVSSTSKSD